LGRNVFMATRAADRARPATAATIAALNAAAPAVA